MNNIMLDIETLGVESDSAILSIGAVLFDIKTGALGTTFYKIISLDSSLKFGRVEGNTLKWWITQSPRAKEIFNSRDAVTLESALNDFSEFVSQVENVCVWGNGSSFDNVILKNAYNKLSMPVPWNFRNDRDVRTIIALTQDILNINSKNEVVMDGVTHNALDDAIYQAKYVHSAFKSLSK